MDVAARMHAKQKRKKTDVPYLSHLLGTCAIALEYGASEDEAIAALLHGAIEDVQPVDRSRAAVAAFGPKVLAIVEACSDADAGAKGPWRERKEAYIAGIAHEGASVLLVSASDKLHNARAIVADVHSSGADVWNRFNAGRADVIWYYEALVRAFAGTSDRNPGVTIVHTPSRSRPARCLPSNGAEA
ncbi:MAG: HD domain-containing protein [Chloroflexi bacterium]|nr:HD domain-containing protein [Chloroflexota bacterium]